MVVRRTMPSGRHVVRSGAWSAVALSLVGLVLLAACGDAAATEPDQNEPVVIAAESPTLQYVSAARGTPTPVVVRVLDSTGHPLVRRRVTFVASNGALEVATGLVRTDSTGRARLPRWLVRDSRIYEIAVRVGSGAPMSFKVLSLPPQVLGGETAASCPLPDRTLPRFAALTHTAALLRAGSPLRVVALGSSSTFGTGLASQQSAYPSQLEGMLHQAFPSSAVTVINAGVPGNIAADLDARLDASVLAEHPDLVILQTGTNDALRRVPIDSLRAITERTIMRLQRLGIEVIVLDPQRFSGAGETDEYRSYVAAVAASAEARGIGTAHRYGWMTSVLDTHRYTYADLLSVDGLHQSSLSHLCTAHLLTTGIAVAVLEAAAQP